jgi:hypothetical protein
MRDGSHVGVEVTTSIADFGNKILPTRWLSSSREGLVFVGTHATGVGDSGRLGIRVLVTGRYLAWSTSRREPARGTLGATVGTVGGAIVGRVRLATLGTVFETGATFGTVLSLDAGASIGVAQVDTAEKPRNSGTHDDGASIGLTLWKPWKRGTRAAPVERTLGARLGELDGPAGGTIDGMGEGMTMGTSGGGAINGMLEEGAPSSEGAPNEGDDGYMVGMELVTMEGSTDGMMVGGLDLLPVTGSGLI